MTCRSTIDEFLGVKRLAVIGVSRHAKDFTRSLFRELQEHGYELVPVHPEAAEIEGIPAVANVKDVQPAVEGALLLTKPAVTDVVVRECRDAGIPRIWLHRGAGAGAGAVSREAIEFCSQNKISLVEGECPYMFLPDSGFPHNVHAFCRKLLGRYPK